MNKQSSSNIPNKPIRPVLYYEQIKIGDKEIHLNPNSVVVFVGPNNVGKTTALMELQNKIMRAELTYNNKKSSVIKSVTLTHSTDESELEAWAMNFMDDRPPESNNPDDRRFRNWSIDMTMPLLDFSAHVQFENSREAIGGFLVSRGEGVQFEGPSPNIYEPESTNSQFEQLYSSQVIADRLSKLSEEAFGSKVELSRIGSKSVLHYGDLPKLVDPTHPTSEEKAAIYSTPKVSEQGQGVVTLMKLGVSMELGHEPLVFLDEPEAHLHPPQSRLAGRYVAERSKHSQVFISTHSVEFILGLLDNPENNITIIRLDRKDGTTSASVLDGNDLVEAWKDPFVKYSRALSGLMHKGVVICEGDGDCLYYEVALEHLREKSQDPRHDLLFIQCGGKAGAQKPIAALKKLAVPTCVIADFDMLRSWSELKSLISALGGEPGDYEKDWKVVSSSLTSKNDPRTVLAIKNQLDTLFKAYSDNDSYTSKIRDSIHGCTKTEDGWKLAKELGLRALKGVPLTTCKRLVESLAKIGLVVCPFGELESFHPEAPAAHGSTWVTYAIEHKLYTTLDADQEAFVKKIPSTCVIPV